MIARAVEKYIRMSPRKVRYVMEPLRNQTVAQALSTLAAMNRRAAGPVAKAIASAFANARQADPALSEDQTVIRRLFADGGPMWKRHRAAAFGRAVMIQKRTSHITVELDRIDRQPSGSAPAVVEAEKAAAPVRKRHAVGRPSVKPKAKSTSKPNAARPKKRAGGRNSS